MVHVPRFDRHAEAQMDDDDDNKRTRSEDQEDDDDDNKTESSSSTITGSNPIVTDDPNIAPNDDWSKWKSNREQNKPSVTPSPSSSSQQITLPENARTSGTPTPTPTFASPTESPAIIASGTNGLGDNTHEGKHGSNDGRIKATAASVSVAVILLIAAIVFFYVRKRKKQKQIAAQHAQVQEMKLRSPPIVQAHVALPEPPPQSPSSSYFPPPSQSSSSIIIPPQPVILGPISSESSGNYFTGIDTSDAMSVHDDNERAGLGNPFADNNSLNEEPPPPYRPRSVVLLSRNSSARASPLPPATSSNTSLIGSRSQMPRSPFDDSQDDTVSEMSGPTQRRNVDTTSTVSDLSYQQDPVVGKPAV